MNFRLIILLVTVFLVVSCSVDSTDWFDHEDKTVSIIRLIGTPGYYHNEKVRIEGFLHVEFEGNAIYLHKEDYDQGLSKNGLWVSFPDSLKVRMTEASNHYVLIDGTFDKRRHGHFGSWAGEVKDITRVMVLKSY